MNKKDRLKTTLSSIASHEVPETINLWPQIAARIERREMVAMKPRLKLLWSSLIVLLALVLATSVVYALYNYFKGDQGMEAVSQSGMVEDMNVTAVPTLLPTATPLPPALPIGTAQTRRGVTLTLNWVYLDEMWQAIGFSVAGLNPDQKIGIPLIGFGKIQPQQYQGAGMTLKETTNGLEGIYVVHQIVRDMATYMVADMLTDVNMEIPILDSSGQVLDSFRFKAPQVPIHQEPYGGGNTYAVRSNGLEMRLEWMIFTPQETRARLCYAQSDDATLTLDEATLQWAQDVSKLSDAPRSLSQHVIEVGNVKSQRCVEAIFPPFAPESKAFRLAVEALKDANGMELPGRWEFVWSTLPHQAVIPSITPLATQSIGDVKVTLLQAYADALRFAAVLRLEGAPPEQVPTLELTDNEGKPFNTGFSLATDENDPTLFTASFTFDKPEGDFISQQDPAKKGRFLGKLVMNINPWDQSGGQSFTFDLDLPLYPSMVVNPGQSSLSEGLEMRLEKLEITPSFTKAYLCYQKPSAADWGLNWENTILQIGETQSRMTDYSLVLDEDYGMQERPEWASLPGRVRCVWVGFPLGHNNKPAMLTLTINGLDQSIPEMIPTDQLQAARQALRQQGIEIDWVTFSGNGGGGAGPQITQKPEGMSDDEVLRLFYEALGYHFRATWTFTLEINPQ